MNLDKQNVLFIVRTMGLGGTEKVVLQLCNILCNKVNKIIVCSTGGCLESELNKIGVKHYKIKDVSSKNPFSFVSTYLTLKRIILKEKITIVHSHHRMAALFAELVSPKSIIKLANAHNTFYNKKLLTKFAYKNTFVVAVGEMVKNNLIDYFKIPSSQIYVIHNAVSPFTEEIKIIDSIYKEKQKGNIIIGNVGRLAPQKGMEFFIKSAEVVVKKHSNARFFIVGEGELKKDLLELIKKLNLEKICYILGYRSDVQNVMSQCDFIVLSSLWEGLPLTPIESFSVSKTVVATNVDGTPEIVKNKENGLLVEAKNVNEMASKICYLIENESEKNKFENNAKLTYENYFSYNTMQEKYISFYERLR